MPAEGPVYSQAVSALQTSAEVLRFAQDDNAVSRDERHHGRDE